MTALLAASPSIQLFTPLLLGTALALFVLMLGRLVSTRKPTRAPHANDGLLEPRDFEAPVASLLHGLGVPRAIHHDSLFVAEVGGGDAVVLRFRDRGSSGVPDPIESQPTRRYIRTPEISAEDASEVTLRFERVYLDGDDVVEC